ncbi:MAG: DHA2 family efflux MFS transporter permease subunit [Tannerellaceae bacterium]|nr:DHA2 family efflux MFS transporter permease subunit [Tannerellaceae bacterium]
MKLTTGFSFRLPWLAAMAMFMQSLDTTILNTALPVMAKDLNHSPLQMQAVVISYALTLALLIPLSGWFSDRYGTKRVFMLAVFLFTAGSLYCALSPSFRLLVGSRILQAIGGSMMVPVARLALIYAFPKDRLLAVINFITVPGLVGLLIGPLLGGWLVDVASWHWIFLINLPVGIAGIWMAYKVMLNYKRATKKLDVLGFILFSTALISLSFFLEAGSAFSLSFPWSLVILAAALFFGTTYVFYSKRIDNPVVDLRLLKIRTLRVGLEGNLVTRLAIGSMPFLLPQMLQLAFLHTPTQSGMIMMVSALSTICAKSLVVPLVRKLGYKKILISNTAFLGIVVALFALPDKTTPLLLLAPVLAIYGCFNSIQMTTMNTISLADLTDEVASRGNSMVQIMQQLSTSFGVSVGALLLRGMESATWLTHNNLALSFKYTFLVLGMMTFVSALVFTQLKKEDGDTMSGRQNKQSQKDSQTGFSPPS